LSKIPRDQLRICIAEDNHINQKIAISFVQKLGFKCDAFLDGRKAIDALEKASAEGMPYHLVLMDVQMPVLDGYDATREIRRHKDPAISNVLVIAMTASAIQGDREKCLDAGMNNYLAKPVRVHTLKDLLETYLSQSPKPIPNLQEEGNKLVRSVLNEALVDDTVVEGAGVAEGAMSPPRPPSLSVEALNAVGTMRPPMSERAKQSSDKTVVPADNG